MFIIHTHYKKTDLYPRFKNAFKNASIESVGIGPFGLYCFLVLVLNHRNRLN